MINAWGSLSKVDAEIDGVHWDLPLNTPIALLYGELDLSFKYDPNNVRARTKTGSVGLTYSYISKKDGHDITSLWNPVTGTCLPCDRTGKDPADSDKKCPNCRGRGSIETNGL